MSKAPGIYVQEVDVLTAGSWSFEASTVTWGGIIFDPFPAYPHERPLVDEMVEHVLAIAKPIWPVTLTLVNREAVSRVNAWAQCREGEYVKGTWDRGFRGSICMNAKRIPPHPGMTRHLVGHEYGHNVQYMLNVVKGFNYHAFDMLEEYATLRGSGEVHSGSGGNWHSSIQEVFACDFRSLVCGLENEYWPHPGVGHPNDLTQPVMQWWADALGELHDFDPAQLEEVE